MIFIICPAIRFCEIIDIGYWLVIWVLRPATVCRCCGNMTFVETNAPSVYFVVVFSVLVVGRQSLYLFRRLGSGQLVKDHPCWRPLCVTLSRHIKRFCCPSVLICMDCVSCMPVICDQLCRVRIPFCTTSLGGVFWLWSWIRCYSVCVVLHVWL